MSPLAFKGFRSMLSAVFRHTLPEISSSPVLKDLIRSFEIATPFRGIAPSSLDLDRVLSSLRREPFEPLESAIMRDLTIKTLFLIAQATAKRVGELQALSGRVTSSGSDRWLSYVPGFVVKADSSTNPIPRTLILKSLVDFAANLEDELLLCPVRALNIYLEKTRGITSRPSTLFVSHSKPSRSISKNAISFFLRSLISGSVAPEGDGGLPPWVHSIRAVSTLVAFLRNWSLAKVLEAAKWRSNLVFASFYLKDVHFQHEGFRSLDTFVAAGQVIGSSSSS